MLYLDITHSLHKQLLVYFLQDRQFPVTLPQGHAESIPSDCILLTDRWNTDANRNWVSRQIWLIDLTKPMPSVIPKQVMGLLNSATDLAELETCIQQVMGEQRYVGEDVLTRFVQAKRESVSLAEAPQLTKRQHEILTFMQAGYTLRIIAEKLYIGLATV